MVTVPKRDGTHRICIDYRKLNNYLVNDSYSLPRIEDIFCDFMKIKFFLNLRLEIMLSLNINSARRQRKDSVLYTNILV